MRTLFALTLVSVITWGVAAPVVAQSPQSPEVGAVTWVLYDADLDRVLASHDADVRRPMASTTKMMTALLALENATVADEALVSEEAASIGGAGIGYVAGETVLMEDLVAALLLQSANDSAITIAEHVAGVESVFVGMMNDRARELGMENTSFANPHGLDSPNHYSSANDLLTLALEGMSNPDFARLVSQPEVQLDPAPDGSERIALNRNELIGTYEGAIGVKTGFTDDAGLVLVAAAERDGRTLYAVVMGSEEHFSDAAALLDYGLGSFDLFELLDTGPLTAPAAIDVSERRFTGAMQLAGSAATESAFGTTVVGPSGGTVGQDPPPGWVEALAWPLEYWDRLWSSDE